MTMDSKTIWLIIIVLGIGTFLIRFSFLGALGNRKMPPLVLRLLRYTPVAVLPALVAPLVVWPQATEGQPEPARLAAAAVTIGVGYMTKSVLAAMIAGAVVLVVTLQFLG